MTDNKKNERVDLLLKQLQIVKSREKAKYACEKGMILVNSEKVKPSLKISAGDVIKITLSNISMEYKIIGIPDTKNIRKSDVSKYYKIVKKDE